MQAWLPRWSPDGKRIAFSAEVPGEPDRIYVVAADGGRPAQLTAENHYETDPNWSPDQNSLMFGGEPWMESGAVAIRCLTLRHAKSQRFLVLRVCTRPIGHPTAATSWRCLDARKLMLFDFSTHTWAELVSSPAAYPNWSPDGSYIYFSNPYIAEPAVYRTDQRPETGVGHEPEPPAPGMEHRGEVDGSHGG